MDRLERDEVVLQGKFIEELYDGLDTQTYLFKDNELGWYSIQAIKGTKAHDQLKTGEEATVKIRLVGNLKTNGTKVNCYNELILEVYKAKELVVRG